MRWSSPRTRRRPGRGADAFWPIRPRPDSAHLPDRSSTGRISPLLDRRSESGAMPGRSSSSVLAGHSVRVSELPGDEGGEVVFDDVEVAASPPGKAFALEFTKATQEALSTFLGRRNQLELHSRTHASNVNASGGSLAGVRTTAAGGPI